VAVKYPLKMLAFNKNSPSHAYAKYSLHPDNMMCTA